MPVEPPMAEPPIWIEIEPPFPYYEPSFDCGYSDAEVEAVEMVVDLFRDKTSSHITNRLFSDSNMKELVESYIQERMMSLENALVYCQDGQRLGQFPYNYEGFVIELVQMVGTLKALTQYENTMSDNDLAAESFDQLRDIIMWDSLANMQDNSLWLQQIVSMTFGLSHSDNFGQRDIDLTLDANGIGTADGTTSNTTMKLEWAMSIVDGETDLSTDRDLTAQVRMVDNTIYAQIQDFDVELWDITFDNQYDAQSFNQMLAFMDLVKGKFIEIPTSPDVLWYQPYSGIPSPVPVFGDLQNQQEMILEVLTQDWLSTYHTDGDTIYAWLNPVACTSMREMDATSDCLDAWKDMMDHTDGKWMFFMKKYDDGTTVMWVTDTFAGDWMPEEMRKLSDLELISRDDNGIASIEIPLYDGDEQVWYFQYDGYKIQMNAAVPNQRRNPETWEITMESFDMQWQGTRDPIQWLDIGVTGSDDRSSMELDIQANWDTEDMFLDMNLSYNSDDEYNPMNMSISLELDGTSKEIPVGIVNKPNDSEVLDIMNIMQLMWGPEMYY